MSVSVIARPTRPGTTLLIAGALDASSSAIFQETMLRAARSHPSPLLLDLSGIHFIDRAGLSALITIRRLIEARDGRLRVIRTSLTIRRIIGLTGAQHVLDEDTAPAPVAARRRAR